jgi:ABC-type transporter Mla subunit MlaD
VDLPSPFGVVRAVLGASEHAEQDVAHAMPLHETQALEEKLEDALAAIRRAAEAMERHAETMDRHCGSLERQAASLERHAEVLGSLSDALPALTDSVTHLTDELGRLMSVTAPLAAAEHEAGRLEGLFRRRRPTTAGDRGSEPAAAEDKAGLPQG